MASLNCLDYRRPDKKAAFGEAALALDFRWRSA